MTWITRLSASFAGLITCPWYLGYERSNVITSSSVPRSITGPVLDVPKKQTVGGSSRPRCLARPAVQQSPVTAQIPPPLAHLHHGTHKRPHHMPQKGVGFDLEAEHAATFPPLFRYPRPRGHRPPNTTQYGSIEEHVLSLGRGEGSEIMLADSVLGSRCRLFLKPSPRESFLCEL